MMVEPRELHAYARRVYAHPARDAKAHGDGTIAQAHIALPRGIAHHRFGHDAHRVREVDEPGVGAELFHVADDVENDRDGAERLEHSAGSVGLLADEPVLEGDALVGDARVQLPHAKLRSHKVHARKGLPPIERKVYVHGYARRFDHAPRQSAHGLQFFLALRHIHEPELAHRARIVAPDEPLHELWRIAGAAADCRDLNAFHSCLPTCSQHAPDKPPLSRNASCRASAPTAKPERQPPSRNAARGIPCPPHPSGEIKRAPSSPAVPFLCCSIRLRHLPAHKGGRVCRLAMIPDLCPKTTRSGP